MLEVILRHLQLAVELVEDLGHIRGLQVDPSAHRCMLIGLDSVVLAAWDYLAEVRNGGVGVSLRHLEAFARDSNGGASKALRACVWVDKVNQAWLCASRVTDYVDLPA